jgi:hypothetical protein
MFLYINDETFPWPSHRQEQEKQVYTLSQKTGVCFPVLGGFGFTNETVARQAG